MKSKIGVMLILSSLLMTKLSLSSVFAKFSDFLFRFWTPRWVR